MRPIQTIILISFMIMNIQCQDTLPEYITPQNFTQAILSEYSGVLFPDTERTISIAHHCADTTTHQIGIGLKNLFDETLDGNRFFNIHVEMESLDPRLPYYREWDLKDEIPGTENITIDPNDTYIVAFTWNRRDNNGRLIDTGVDTTFFAGTTAPASPPIPFRLRGSIQVWQQVPPRFTNEFILRIILHRDWNCTYGPLY